MQLRCSADSEQDPTDDSYRHPYIAPLGVGRIPLLDRAVRRGESLFTDFTEAYILAGSGALKDKLLEPQFVLAQVAVLLPEDEEISEAFYGSMFPTASMRVRNAEELSSFPDTNVVWASYYEDLDAVESVVPNLSGTGSGRGLVHAAPRGRGAPTFVLAGIDRDAIVALIEGMAERELSVTEGIVLALD